MTTLHLDGILTGGCLGCRQIDPSPLAVSDVAMHTKNVCGSRAAIVLIGL
jgi:hypothetical protein